MADSPVHPMATSTVARTTNLEDMPTDLLDYILKKLISMADYFRFGSVCKKWRSVTLEQKQYRMTYSSSQHQPPLLILPYDASGDLDRKVYKFHDNKIHTDQMPIPIEYRDRQFYSGSFFGWLVFAEADLGITLIKPNTDSPYIRLPPVMRMPELYRNDITSPECLIYKVFISCDPSTDPNYVIAVIFYGNMYGAFIRAGQNRWTGIDKSFQYISDMVFINGSLFAIDMSQQLVEIDYYSGALVTSVAEEEHTLTGDIAVMRYLVTGDDLDFCDVCYIVDIGMGELLHVRRIFLHTEDDELDERLLTVEFKLYKLQNCEWVEIQSIGDLVLFLGSNSSFCMGSTPYFKGNCIYYTDDVFIRCACDPQIADMGVYDIETKIIDDLCELPLDYPTCYRPAALWISPSL